MSENAFVGLPATTHPTVGRGRIHDEDDVSRHGRPGISDGPARGFRNLGPPAPSSGSPIRGGGPSAPPRSPQRRRLGDRKSTRLNSSHGSISYAVFCLKKKKKKRNSSIRSKSSKILHAPVVHVSKRLSTTLGMTS